MKAKTSLAAEILAKNAEIELLRNELENAQETLRAIQSGDVDALVVQSEGGERIFTLKSADLPYRVLVETMSEGAATISSDGSIIYCNQRFADMTEHPLERVIGTGIEKFICKTDLDEFRTHFKYALSGQAKCALRILALTNEGVPAIFSMSAVALETGTGVCLVATDLTEQRRLEESQADVERLNIEKELRERFVATLSHDLRNPLSAAKISAQMIVRYPDRHDMHQAVGSRIIQSIERADKMIQNLLDANRIRAGEKLPLDICECDLRQTAEETVSELTLSVGERFLLQGQQSVVGYWSCEQLRRVVENLAMNAIKYGATDRPVKIILGEDKTSIILSVHNEGEPITPEEQEVLFKPFSRTRSAFTSGQKGWGLGLTLVRGVAEAHGGTVHVESAPQKGTTFHVKLPRDSRPYQEAQHQFSTGASL